MKWSFQRPYFGTNKVTLQMKHKNLSKARTLHLENYKVNRFINLRIQRSDKMASNFFLYLICLMVFLLFGRTGQWDRIIFKGRRRFLCWQLQSFQGRRCPRVLEPIWWARSWLRNICNHKRFSSSTCKKEERQTSGYEQIPLCRYLQSWRGRTRWVSMILHLSAALEALVGSLA